MVATDVARIGGAEEAAARGRARDEERGDRERRRRSTRSGRGRSRPRSAAAPRHPSGQRTRLHGRSVHSGPCRPSTSTAWRRRSPPVGLTRTGCSRSWRRCRGSSSCCNSATRSSRRSPSARRATTSRGRSWRPARSASSRAIPTAYTQPLYSYFLIPLYWAFGRTWEVVGGAQILVAVATVLLVYEIGRRWLPRWAGLLAALIVAVHPYSIWHDVHINREILDGLLAAAIFLGCDDPARAPVAGRRGLTGRDLRAGDPVERPAGAAAARPRCSPRLVLAPDAGARC